MVRVQRTVRRRIRYRTAPVVDQVMYESYYGAGILCSPEAIFREAVDSPDLAHLTHVWVVRDDTTALAVKAEFSAHPRVRFVQYQSREYMREMYRSRYLVNNSTWPSHFVKRPGQRYMNTWHGTPLKRMGFDMPDGVRGAANTLRNFLKADYLVSPNPFTTKTMFRDAYRLEGIYQGWVLETGYPRADIQTRLGGDRAAARGWLATHGIVAPEDAAVVLIAPTWKGESFQRPDDDAAEWERTVIQLQERLGGDYFVIAKLHQAVASQAEGLTGLEGRLVSTAAPTNGVLAATDVLVTDFSSIYFDFLSLRRPILFYVPEESDYTATRGTYLPLAELPGPVVGDVPTLATRIETMRTGRDGEGWEARVAEAAARFAPWDDGKAAARAVDVLLRGVAPQDRSGVRLDDAGKSRLLVYVGGLLQNGISTSAMNLLRNLDYDRFDVSFTYPYPNNATRRGELAKADPRARPIETGTGVAEDGRPPRWLRRGRSLPAIPEMTRRAVRSAFGAEWHRTFGDATFDHIVDFSGYSPVPAAIMLAGPARTHSIWMHNDLAADRERQVEDRLPHWSNLGQVFELYPLYDSLVSVSPALRDINSAHLRAHAGAEKFVSAVNSIDYQRVLEGRGRRDLEMDLIASGTLDPARALARSQLLERDHEWITFATVGRMSPEKNHERLIRAFARLADDEPRARVAIIGGGPLLESLVELATELGVADRVHFTGQTAHPFAYLDAADCFVLSSDYEGQPMVILEARTLGLPVISTRFGSVESALPPGTGEVVDQSVDALAAGMRRFLAGEVHAEPFDPAEYNREAMRQFYAAIGA